MTRTPAWGCPPTSPPPRLDTGAHRPGEVRCHEQRRQLRITVVRLSDAVEEAGPDDAAAAPYRRHRATVDAPGVLGAAGRNVVETLRVRDDLRGVQGAAHVVDVELELAHRAAEGVPGRRTLVRVPGQRTGERRLRDAGDRDAEVECALHGPATGALLLGLIEHHVDERPAGFRVRVGEHIG